MPALETAVTTDTASMELVTVLRDGLERPAPTRPVPMIVDTKATANTGFVFAIPSSAGKIVPFGSAPMPAQVPEDA